MSKIRTVLGRLDDSGNFEVVTVINDLSENKDKNYMAIYFLDEKDYQIENKKLISKKPVTYEEALNFKKNNMA